MVILHPKVSHKRGRDDSTAIEFASNATEHRGGASRTYRNMVVFLAADEDGLESLDNAVRNFLGWSEVLDKHADLNLTQSQKDQAEAKKEEADGTVDSRLLIAYQWALLPHGQPIEIRTSKVEAQEGSLAEQATKRLENDGDLATQQAGTNIVMQLNEKAKTLWESGHVSVGDLWQTYAQYPYMPRLVDAKVLREGLRQAPVLWQEEGYALASGYDEAENRYIGLVIPTDQQWGEAVTEQTLVVKPEVAMAQRQAEDATTSAPDPSGDPIQDPESGGKAVTPVGQPDSGDGTAPPLPLKTRFFGTKRLSQDRYANDFKQIADEILAHLAANPGVEINLTVEIEAIASDGFEDGQVRTISENAGTLKFDQSGFEES